MDKSSRSMIGLLTIGVVGVACSAVFAAERVGPQQRRARQERIDALKKELGELHAHRGELAERGRRIEGERVERRIAQLEMQQERRAHQRGRRELRELRDEVRRELHELRRQGKHDRADLLEAELHELERIRERREDQRRPGPHEMEDFERRIHHLRQAAENLQAAGMHEPAEELMHHAEGLEREMHERRGDHLQRPDLERHVAELTEIVHELRAEVAELRQAVKRLQQKAQKRPKEPKKQKKQKQKKSD